VAPSGLYARFCHTFLLLFMFAVLLSISVIFITLKLGPFMHQHTKILLISVKGF